MYMNIIIHVTTPIKAAIKNEAFLVIVHQVPSWHERKRERYLIFIYTESIPGHSKRCLVSSKVPDSANTPAESNITPIPQNKHKLLTNSFCKHNSGFSLAMNIASKTLRWLFERALGTTLKWLRTSLQILRKQSSDNFMCFVIAESDFLSTISGRIVVNGVGGELRVAFIRSLLHTSQTHVSAVSCFPGGLPLSRLTGGAVGDTSYTRESGMCCFILSPKRCVVLPMYLFPHAQVKR